MCGETRIPNDAYDLWLHLLGKPMRETGFMAKVWRKIFEAKTEGRTPRTVGWCGLFNFEFVFLTSNEAGAGQKWQLPTSVKKSES